MEESCQVHWCPHFFLIVLKNKKRHALTLETLWLPLTPKTVIIHEQLHYYEWYFLVQLADLNLDFYTFKMPQRFNVSSKSWLQLLFLTLSARSNAQWLHRRSCMWVARKSQHKCQLFPYSSTQQPDLPRPTYCAEAETAMRSNSCLALSSSTLL